MQSDWLDYINAVSLKVLNQSFPISGPGPHAGTLTALASPLKAEKTERERERVSVHRFRGFRV